MSFRDFGLSNYPDYLGSKHWSDLKEDLLYKRGSECWICRNWATLLLHHIDYSALYKEKLYDDVFILCFKCHNLAHFWFNKQVKVPLTPKWLLFSMRLRKVLYLLQNRHFSASLLWLSVIVVIGIFNIVGFLLKRVFVLIGALSWSVLVYSLSKLHIDVE